MDKLEARELGKIPYELRVIGMEIAGYIEDFLHSVDVYRYPDLSPLVDDMKKFIYKIDQAH